MAKLTWEKDHYFSGWVHRGRLDGEEVIRLHDWHGRYFTHVFGDPTSNKATWDKEYPPSADYGYDMEVSMAFHSSVWDEAKAALAQARGIEIE